MTVDPNYARAYSNRSLAYYNIGDINNASKDAKKARELGDCERLQLMKNKGVLRN
ncbi:MAG: hypothetical protein LBQ52_08720 [Helicobacteraceae bacterium]|nr:hypothetical protein [Helicobacteraceae bacterium]